MHSELFELPAVRLAPVDELAAAARGCDRLQSVRRLAEWVGHRRITRSGNLTLADARSAVQELRLPGDQGPGRARARNATQFPELHELWQLAVDVEFVYADQGQAEAGPALEALVRDRDEDVAEVWADLLDATLDPVFWTPALSQGLLPLLLRLYVDPGPVATGDLVLEAMAGPADLELDAIRNDPIAQVLVSGYAPAVQALLGDLREIDAIIIDGDQVSVTALGRYGLVAWFESVGVGAPAVTDLGEASASELLDLGVALRDRSGRGVGE